MGNLSNSNSKFLTSTMKSEAPCSPSSQKLSRSKSNPESSDRGSSDPSDSLSSNLLLDSRMHSLPGDDILKDLSDLPCDISFQRQHPERNFELTKLKAQNAWIKAQMSQLNTISISELTELSQNERSSAPANHSPRASKLSPLTR